MLRGLAQTLSVRAEFVIVLLLSLGYFVFGSTAALLAATPRPPITDASLLGLLIYEPVVFVALTPFLRARGWTLTRFGLRPGLRDTLIGLGLAAVYYGLFIILWLMAVKLWPELAEQAAKHPLVGGHVAMWTVLLVSIVNPLFEELFVCAYVVSVLKPRGGLWLAVNASTLLRLSYHLYQGPGGVLTIVPLGLLLAYWYGRSGRLWPAVVVHAIIDFTGLVGFVGP